MTRKNLLFIWIATPLMVLMTCNADSRSNAKTKDTLRFGIGAVISPKETISTYRHMLQYLEEELDMPVQMVQRKNYEEMDKLLKSKDVSIAMLCSGPYVADHDDFGAELLVAPLMYGKPFYHSYIIVPIDSEIKDIDGLRGKVFAFTDPKSNTGCIAPKYILAKKGEKPDTFFKKYIFSGHHRNSIEMVANKEVDGAAVDNLVWEYMNRSDPRFTSKTKIISKSPQYGTPPIVVNPSIDPQLKDRIKKILLEMHNDANGRQILDKIFIDQFVEVPDSNYNSVREMILLLKNQQ